MMAEETRCPMCSQPNPADAEVCQHCGARLKPLDIRAEPVGDDQPSPREPLGASSEEGEQDWLDRIRSAAEAEESSSAPSDAQAPEGVDEWLERIEPVVEGAEPPEGSVGEDVPFSEAKSAEEIPEWLRRIRSREDRPVEGQQGEEWLAQLREQPEAEQPAEALGAEAQPAEAVSQDLGPSPEQGPMPVEPPKWPGQASEELMPSWLQDVESEARSEEEEEAAEPEELPRVPALIVEAEEEEGEQAPLSPGEDLAGIGVPDWIGEIEPAEDELPRPEDGEIDLAPATLPSWLEAMRPVETFRQVQIEADEDQSVESVGPLAGLRGVLMAEPVVAMPRSATIGSMQLAVTERQYAQAELLARMVEEEERELPVAERRSPQLTIVRWVIAGLIVLANALPVFTGSPHFALPGLEPRELGALFNLVEAVPIDRPALLVFDYEPGYSGELDAVGGTLIEHFMARGLPIATMTTRPTGSPLAVRTIDRIGANHDYQVGENVVHLGYLSGGPTAVQIFAIEPREAIRGGFALPETMRQAGRSAWQTSVLEQIDSLDDFGVVVVFTAGTETARVWAEQAKARMGDTPLVMVLSAGAEPMVRPYFEASIPQVNGILTGLPAATAYERRRGQQGLAQERWDAFGSAMLAAELVLMAGIGYGIVLWWFGRQES